MGLTDKAKELTDAALLKAGELSEVAREKAPGYLDRAADLAAKATEAAGSRVDGVTGGRYHDRIEELTTKVEHSLDRPRTAEQPTVVDEPEATADPDATGPEGPTTTR